MLRFLTAGESHGPTQTAILEGIPAGLSIDLNDIQSDLDKRRGNIGRGGRGKIEKDLVEILSGVRFGKTLGSPIALMVENFDYKNWAGVKLNHPGGVIASHLRKITNPRPGHADLAGMQKFSFDDARNILERASARETVMRTAVGAICKKFLREFKISIISHPVQIGNIQIHSRPRKNSIYFSDKNLRLHKKINKLILETRKNKNTLGGVIEIMALNVPPGLGSYIQWDKRLDSLIAQALMSIPSVKAVEIGDGIESAGLFGSQVHDRILWTKNKIVRATNHAGGIEGGMSNGENIVCRAFFKPLPTLGKPLDTIDVNTKKRVKAHIERSDICIIPRAGVICEAMLAFVLAQVFLEKFGGDSMKETKRNFAGYINDIKRF